MIAHKWSLFDKRTRVVLPPTYFPAFAICQVQFNHEVTVLQVIEGRSFPASTTTVDWFTFDASLSLLTADPETVAVSRAEATRLWNLASVRLLTCGLDAHVMMNSLCVCLCNPRWNAPQRSSWKSNVKRWQKSSLKNSSRCVGGAMS